MGESFHRFPLHRFDLQPFSIQWASKSDFGEVIRLQEKKRHIDTRDGSLAARILLVQLASMSQKASDLM